MTSNYVKKIYKNDVTIQKNELPFQRIALYTYNNANNFNTQDGACTKHSNCCVCIGFKWKY